MKSFSLPLVLGLFSAMSHAAPSPVHLEARQAPITQYISFYDANTLVYEVDVLLASNKTPYSFNTSESLSSFSGRLTGLLYFVLMPAYITY